MTYPSLKPETTSAGPPGGDPATKFSFDYVAVINGVVEVVGGGVVIAAQESTAFALASTMAAGNTVRMHLTPTVKAVA